MKKIYSIVFNFCFVCLLVGLVGIFTTKYAVDFNFASASASAKAITAKLAIPRSIAFVKNNSNAAILNLNDGSETLIPEKFNEIKAVALSPNGDKIAIAGKLKEENGIYLADTATKTVTGLVSKKDVFFNSPSFSSDGTLLTYIASVKNDPFSPSNIMILDIAKKAEKNITNQKATSEINVYYNYPKFSKDSKTIICSAANIPDVDTPRYDTIYIKKIGADNGAGEFITGGATTFDEKGAQSGFKASVPTLLEDGKIGFLKIVANTERILSVVDPAKNNEVTDITPAVENIAGPSFSKDGKFVVFEIFNDDDKNPQSSINLLDVSAKSFEKIVEKGNSPSF
ncbi:MAG TPA: hypothetical protein PKK26_13675 [Candidatus Wallbacteria bacterium]|nr:hypothetical protein [Candidatus Wallbacteria bacterium]